jgi:histidinol-phosphatase
MKEDLPLSRDAVSAYRDTALRLVSEAGDVVARRLAGSFSARKKPDKSFVTDVDLEVEQLIRDRISAVYPEHGVLGEEYGALRPESPFQWVIDPIDGTLSLRNRIPLFGTILALLYRNEPVVGVIMLPELGRTYHAARGAGAWRGSERIVIQDVPDESGLPDEVIGISDRHQFIVAGRTDVFDRLMLRHPRMRTYTDCFGHALAVDGSLGAMIDFDLNVWDAAATQVLIEEAGGRYVRLPPDAERPAKYNLVFGKPRVVQWLLEQLDGKE